MSPLSYLLIALYQGTRTYTVNIRLVSVVARGEKKMTATVLDLVFNEPSTLAVPFIGCEVEFIAHSFIP